MVGPFKGVPVIVSDTAVSHPERLSLWLFSTARNHIPNDESSLLKFESGWSGRYGPRPASVGQKSFHKDGAESSKVVSIFATLQSCSVKIVRVPTGEKRYTFRSPLLGY